MLKFSRLPIAILALTIATPVLAQPAASPATPAKPPVTADAPKTVAVDLNTATPTELKALPGMTEADAAKIIHARPYRDVNELVSKKIVPETEFARIKDRVTVHPKS
jgi:DNA uptake protein ComE-like DNA-binding protein